MVCVNVGRRFHKLSRHVAAHILPIFPKIRASMDVKCWFIVFAVLASCQLKMVLPVHNTINLLMGPEAVRCRGIPCEEWKIMQEELTKLKANSKPDGDKDFNSVMNDDEGDVMTIDGDIWLSLVDIRDLEDKLRTRHKRKLAKFNEGTKEWHLPIHYYIDSKFDAIQINSIKGAIDHWQHQTCIRFTELDVKEALNRQNTKQAFVYFVKNQRCGSFIGRIPSAVAQQVYLSDQCVQQWGAIVHEIGHVIGFWHEHQRSDRDDYVTILSGHMTSGADSAQFAKGDTRDLVPYDYSSIMHYRATTNGKSVDSITIQTRDPRYLYTVGQKIELSFLDAKLANLEYCAGRCTNVITCRNQGYQNPNDCYRCNCPDGFSGDTCEKLAPSEKANCGGVIILKDKQNTVYITSPGYTQGATYSDHTRCSWLLKAPKGYKVNLMFMDTNTDHFGLYCNSPVCSHWVEVKMMTSDMSISGPRFCCKELNGKKVLPGVMTSESNYMMVLMRSNFTTSKREGSILNLGFRASVWISADKLDSKDEVLTSPLEVLDPGQMALDPVHTGTITVLPSVASHTINKGAATTTMKTRTTQAETRTTTTIKKATSAKTTATTKSSISTTDLLPKKIKSSSLEKFNLSAKTAKNWLTSVILKGRPIIDQSINKSTTTTIPATTTTTTMTSNNYKSSKTLSNDKFQQVIPDTVRTKLLNNTNTDMTSSKSAVSSKMTLVMGSQLTKQTGDVKEEEASIFSWNCGFEDASRSLCGMTQEESHDQFDWSRHTGRTRSAGTGPEGAAEGRYYLYIEASRPRKLNDTATIYTPVVPKQNNYCLQFQYNLYGYHVNELRVHVISQHADVILLTLKHRLMAVGSTEWFRKSIMVHLHDKYKIAFTGIRGTGYSGDIAIDDLSLRTGQCTS